MEKSNIICTKNPLSLYRKGISLQTLVQLGGIAIEV